MKSNMDSENWKVLFVEDIKAPPADSNEFEAERLAEIERDRRNGAYDLEWERLEKEWKASHPNSDRKPYLYELERFAQSATNYPLGWAESFEQIENLITMSRKEFYRRAQEAMNEGGIDAYYKFIGSMSDLASEEGFRRYKAYKRQENAKFIASLKAKRSEGGVK
jgi:hypothetical protein